MTETADKMSREDVKTEWEKPQDNPMESMTPEETIKLMQYRSSLLTKAHICYKALVESILRLPIHVIYRQSAFQNIDQGIHWVRAGIDNVWELPKEETDLDNASVAVAENEKPATEKAS